MRVTVNRVHRVRAAVLEKWPETEIKKLTKRQLARVQRQFPSLPPHLVLFFREFGCGCLGHSFYMLYPLLHPDEVFDKVTAADLKKVVLIGDDFVGTHEAYITGSRWQFGYVTSNGRFHKHTNYDNIVDFVEHWCEKD